MYSQLKEYGWAEKSLSRSLSELQEKGFIEKTRQGGFGLGGKYCSYYRLTHLPTDEIPLLGLRASPPTAEFRQWTPEKKAREALINSIPRKSDSLNSMAYVIILYRLSN